MALGTWVTPQTLSFYFAFYFLGGHTLAALSGYSWLFALG